MSDTIVLVSPDTVGSLMAGPAIRFVEMARALSAHFDVTLAAPDGSMALPDWPFALLTYRDRAAIVDRCGRANATVVQGDVLTYFPELRETARTLVVDLYDPFFFESLRQQGDRAAPLQRAWHETVMDLTLDLIRSGDFFICASERQRDLWLGMLSATGRLSPELYAEDRGFERLIDLVPFGLPTSGDEKRAPEPSIPGVEPGDPLIYWGGGVWDWLDPITLIQAVNLLLPERPNLKLLFAGVKRPNAAASAGTAMLERSVNLAGELGLTGSSVIFNDWVPYEAREGYLRRAQIGAVLDLPTPETRFAYRTRVLDHLWAGLPTLISGGSATADLIDDHEIGLTVPWGDVEAVAGAIRRLLDEPIPDERFEAVRRTLKWGRVIEPLVTFCREPRRTRHLVVPQPAARHAGRRGPSLFQLPYYGWLMLRESGIRRTVRSALTYLRFRASRG